MQHSKTTELCRMMDDCTMETNIRTNHFYSNYVSSEDTNNNSNDAENLDKVRGTLIGLDKVKAGSWDKHDSMHTTTRRNNRMMSENDDTRSWNNLESVHSVKVLSRSGSRCGGESNPSLSSSFNEHDMLQGSNSDYNDSICSFASVGETSFSDSIDAAPSSMQIASKTFTLSFDGTGNINDSNVPTRAPRQTIQRGMSYRNPTNSLSLIQETAMDL